VPSPRHGERLRRLSEPLKPVRAPYYVNTFTPGHSHGYGWYWQPAGAERPVWLAVNHVHAEIALLSLLGAIDLEVSPS
jgi:hypothetical protein